LLKELEGKDLDELLKAGNEQLAKFGGGGGGGGAAPAAAAADAAPAAAAPAPVEEVEESGSMGLDLFG
jgi:large subunit ribosomal protein LP2